MSIQPQGEEIRKAAKWIFAERQYDPSKSMDELIEAASIKFDLSPMEVEFLTRFVRQQPAPPPE